MIVAVRQRLPPGEERVDRNLLDWDQGDNIEGVKIQGLDAVVSRE